MHKFKRIITLLLLPHNTGYVADKIKNCYIKTILMHAFTGSNR